MKIAKNTSEEIISDGERYFELFLFQLFYQMDWNDSIQAAIFVAFCL